MYNQTKKNYGEKITIENRAFTFNAANKHGMGSRKSGQG